MLKKTRLFKDLIPKVFKIGNNKIVRNSSSRINKIVVNLSNKLKNNKSKKLMYISNMKNTEKPIFLTPNIKIVFNYLK